MKQKHHNLQSVNVFFPLCLCFLFCLKTTAQSTMQVELLGAYNLIGVSYDKRLSDDYSGFGYKIGIGAGLMYGFKLPGLKLNNVDNFFWQPYLSLGYIMK